MDEFPRTIAGGVSLSRLVIASNWFLGYSHTSAAKDRLIRQYQTRERLADILTVFLKHGVDTILWMPTPELAPAMRDAEQRAGRPMIQIMNPSFSLLPGGRPEEEPGAVLDRCREQGATVCMPHQVVTDALLDKRAGIIRDLDHYTKMIRERGMIPGLSTHTPEVPVYADRQGADVETYIQIYNSAGFLMQVEVDWVMKVIRQAKKPVLVIKPIAAGRLLPAVGLAFVWSTIRDQDMVCVGTMTPDEAKEVIDLSLDFLGRRMPGHELQITRSKQSLISPG
ncbi:MAG: hypothetical protein ACUVWR_08065 [Anaerolineae bacterium]